MTSQHLLIFSFINLLLLSSCERSIDFVDYQEQLVVEGRIENEQTASVLLSTSVSFTEELNQSSLLAHAIRSAKVVISDGEEEEVLQLKTNYEKLPPFEYVSSKIKGEVGKTYTLSIYYKGDTITAQTYIPPPVYISSLSFEKKNENDSVGYIILGFKNESQFNYQVSTRIMGAEHLFRTTLFGNVDRTQYPANQPINIQVSKGVVIYPETNYSTSYPDSALIEVKLSTQTQESFDFWTSYQNEIINSQNPIYPSTTSLKSNIKGGIGIWSGYGSDVKILNPKED